MTRSRLLLTVACLPALALPTPAQETSRPRHLDALPPTSSWNGKSRELVAAPDDPWITPCEESGLTASPSYAETIAWLERLVLAAPELEMITIGRSDEGRAVRMVIASAEGVFTPEALRASGKPTVLVQAGIHSGEIDGKDAGMMLLRDMTVSGEKGELLEGANLLFIPILNVDGHERSSPHGRINQRGPAEMGWRTNARNLNLNRDYAKLDIPELRAAIHAIERWQPDLYVDVHVTDGMDYQYDVTLESVGPHGYSPAIAGWMGDTFLPRVYADLEAQGHVPGPMIFSVDRRDLSKGILQWMGSPRFSHAYGDARHLPTLLVENHSLKPYDRRVLGTYVLLESTLRALAEGRNELRRAVAADRASRPSEVAVSWRVPEGEPDTLEFLAIESRRVPAPASGGTRIEWNGKPLTMTLPHVKITEPARSVAVPNAYWIPPTWPEVIERLEVHGIELQRLEQPRELEVEMVRLTEPVLATAPYEGRIPVTCTPVSERRTQLFPAGSVRVSTDQPLGTLAVLLLEPESPDSFFQWGFFHEVLQRTEYFEAYVMEPLAERMMAEDPALKAEFEALLENDPAFAQNGRARLNWFYERSEYFDGRWRLYPVARER